MNVSGEVGGDVKVDDVISYCLGKPGAEEDYPFREEDMACKVGGKAFAHIELKDGTVGVKCGSSTEEAAELRKRYPDAVTKSPYIGRFGWNNVKLTGGVPAREIRELVDHSYETVVAKLPKSRRP
jgi:predicted DNA-binding protein (MmcQ/YjbR family)